MTSPLLAGCESPTASLLDPSTLELEHPNDAGSQPSVALDAQDAHNAEDAGGAPDAEARNDAGPAPAMFELTERFVVVLDDNSCSGHIHHIRVEPSEYEEDVELHFLGGTHEVVFKVSELLHFQAGGALPFATIGDGRSHGHCGVAYRESTDITDVDRNEGCMVLGTAPCLLN